MVVVTIFAEGVSILGAAWAGDLCWRGRMPERVPSDRCPRVVARGLSTPVGGGVADQVAPGGSEADPGSAPVRRVGRGPDGRDRRAGREGGNGPVRPVPSHAGRVADRLARARPRGPAHPAA